MRTLSGMALRGRGFVTCMVPRFLPCQAWRLRGWPGRPDEKDPVYTELQVFDRGARLRYYSAMATIQVREVPEELYEVLRRRARRMGQSMQAYMRDQIIAIAERPTKEEAIEEIEAIVGRIHGQEPTSASVIEDLAAERR